MNDNSAPAKNKFLRGVINAHYKTEITMLELSTYHNISVTSANNNHIFVWDYEKG
jgi:hypothetical protein